MRDQIKGRTAPETMGPTTTPRETPVHFKTVPGAAFGYNRMGLEPRVFASGSGQRPSVCPTLSLWVQKLVVLRHPIKLPMQDGLVPLGLSPSMTLMWRLDISIFRVARNGRRKRHYLLRFRPGTAKTDLRRAFFI